MSKETKTETAVVPRIPRMGETINVKAASGRRVMNNEAGGWFDEKTAIPVTVNVRILKLLRDKDLIQAR